MIDLSSAFVSVEPSPQAPIPDTIDVLAPTADFFGENSPLREAEGLGGRSYEKRPQQTHMAIAVAEALTAGKSLCVEAPTGVGKSFAYLIPGIHRALQSGRPTMISTETIALQEQLMFKDIPFLQNVMRETPFKAALAKGRSNYVCQRRLRLATSENASIPGFIKEKEVAQLEVWAQNTSDGSLASYPDGQPDPALWACVCSEGGNCLYPSCNFAARCFYWKARRLWNSVHILVVNHALFFTDFKLRLENGSEAGESILPLPGALIIDEAHAIEDAAANHLGIHLSERGIRHSLNRLFDPVSGRGVLAPVPGVQVLEVRQHAAALHTTAAAFFEQLKTLYRKVAEGKEPVPDADSEDPDLTDTPVFTENQLRLLNAIPHLDTLSGPLDELGSELNELARSLRGDDNQNLVTEITAQGMRFQSYAETVRAFMEQGPVNHVYWMIQSRNGNGNLALCSAPVTVAELLAKKLFSDKDLPVILTSATLTVGESFDYFRHRSGFRGNSLRLDSPFDYPRQLTLHIPREMPEPTAPDYMRRLPNAIRYYISKTNGSAFVLFTSYATMRYCYGELLPWFESEEIHCLMQGEMYSRSQMLDRFRDNPGSVIFGTSSFWTGVDVPGDALSNVIIVRLPFPVPSEPLIQARCEVIEARNGNPFMDYSLPEAVIRLRQGAGRLIRSKTDTGILVILDNRILTKRYGSLFLHSLPPCPRIESARE